MPDLTRNRCPSDVTAYKLRARRSRGERPENLHVEQRRRRAQPRVPRRAYRRRQPSACGYRRCKSNSSLRSRPHRGSAPPRVKICHLPPVLGNGCTYTSQVPDSSDVYVIQRPSGQTRPCPSLKVVAQVWYRFHIPRQREHP